MKPRPKAFEPRTQVPQGRLLGGMKPHIHKATLTACLTSTKINVLLYISGCAALFGGDTTVSTTVSATAGAVKGYSILPVAAVFMIAGIATIF